MKRSDRILIGKSLKCEPLSTRSTEYRTLWKSDFFEDCAISYHASYVEMLNKSISKCFIQLINTRKIDELQAISELTISNAEKLMGNLIILSKEDKFIYEHKRILYMKDIISCNDIHKLKCMIKNFSMSDIIPVLSADHCRCTLCGQEYHNFVLSMVKDLIEGITHMEEVIDLISIAKDAIKSCLVSELHWSHRIKNELLMLKHYLLNLSNEDRCRILTNDIIDKYDFEINRETYDCGKSITECMIIQPIPRESE